MTNAALRSLLDYFCNEARNTMHAAFGLAFGAMDARPARAAGSNWRSCLRASRSSADRLLRTIDDVRELVSGQAPPLGSVEEVDIEECLHDIAGLLNLTSSSADAQLVVERTGAEHTGAESPADEGYADGGKPSQPAVIRQDRRALEEVLTRVLQATLQLSRIGFVRVAVSATAEDRVGLTIVTPSSDVSQQLAGWLNTSPEQLDLDSPDANPSGNVDLGILVSVVLAGWRLRDLGGRAAFTSASGAPTGLALDLPCHPAGVPASHTASDIASHIASHPTPHPANRSEPSAGSPRPLQVLVAEDFDESYDLTEMLLEDEAVDRARTGLEALDKVMQRRYDVVFMDIHMPGMSGYDSIRAIRDWETRVGNARTPIVVLSSDDVPTQSRGAAQSGCSGYLRKPVRPSDMASVIDRLRATRAV